jgi:hypothetical protein
MHILKKSITSNCQALSFIYTNTLVGNTTHQLTDIALGTQTYNFRKMYVVSGLLCVTRTAVTFCNQCHAENIKIPFTKLLNFPLNQNTSLWMLLRTTPLKSETVFPSSVIYELIKNFGVFPNVSLIISKPA